MLRTSSPARLHLGRRIGSSALVSVAMLASLTVSAPIAAAKSHQPDPGSCSLGPNGAVKHVDLHPVRQHPSPGGSARRPVGPPADAASPELHAGQRHAALERPHDPDLAHRRRDPLVADGRLPRPARPDRLEQLRPDLVDAGRSRSRARSATGPTRSPPTNTPTVPNMITPTGANAPAPWVPYTRAGCDVGAIATANTVLENTGTGAERRHHEGLRQSVAAGDRGDAIGGRAGRHRRAGESPDRLRRLRHPLRRRAPRPARTARTTRFRTSRAATPASRASSAPRRSTRC